MYFLHNKTVKRLANSTKLYLKSMPSFTYDDYPDCWCEVVSQKTEGEFSQWSLYKNMIDGHILSLLDKKPYCSQIKSLWFESRGADLYQEDEYNYERDLFGPSDLILPDLNTMKDDIIEMVKDELFFSLDDIEDEIRRGKRNKRKISINELSRPYKPQTETTTPNPTDKSKQDDNTMARSLHFLKRKGLL